MSETCVMCGRIIPEGRWACPVCEKKVMEEETMVSATIKYTDGTVETREFTNMIQLAKFVDDRAGSLAEFSAKQVRT